MEEVVEPVAELVAVGCRDAEQLADDHRRDERAELLDVVELLRSDEPLEVAVDERGDGRFEVAHAPWREGAADELTQPVVLGRVHEDHRRVLDGFVERLELHAV